MRTALKVTAREGIVRAVYGRQRARRLAQRHTVSSPPRRILVIRPDHLGDLLFATPALAALRQAFPDAHITGAVGPWGRGMWQDNPDLDDLLVISFPGIASRGATPLTPYALIGKYAAELAYAGYDAAILLRFDHWWGGALTWAAGIPSWGYGTQGLAHWVSHKVEYLPGKHEVEQDLRLVDAIIAETQRIPTLTATSRERGEPALRPPEPKQPPGLPEAWLNAAQRVVIHPGTGAANKLWTISGWAAVADHLAAQGIQVCLTGAPSERELTAAIAERAESEPHDFAGRTNSLGELAWVFSKADMVLGVDSGPLHMAAALHRPSLHLYGPSDERIWGPWGDPQQHRAFRAPGTVATMQLDVESKALEGGPEMTAITIEMVLEEIGKLQHRALYA